MAAAARRCRCQGAAHAYHGAVAQVRRRWRRHRPLPNWGSGAERRAAMNLVRVNAAGMRGDREAGGSRCAVSAILSPGVEGVGRGCGLVGLGTHDTAKRRALMGVRWGMLLLGLGMLSACTVVPTGPHALMLPAVGKSMDVFQVEEGECRD